MAKKKSVKQQAREYYENLSEDCVRALDDLELDEDEVTPEILNEIIHTETSFVKRDKNGKPKKTAPKKNK